MTEEETQPGVSLEIPLQTCLDEAHGYIKAAKAELDGCEHPAIYELTHACDWLLGGLEAVARKLQELEQKG